MDAFDSDNRLSAIDTRWTLVRQAHDEGPAAPDARRALLERYGGAMRRYLLGATRDAEAAEDLFQEFALLFLKGGLRAAEPARGRFRDYVKGILFRLVADHHSGRRGRNCSFEEAGFEPSADWTPERDQEFLTAWRDELLANAWAELETNERETGRLSYTVLRYRAEHPDDTSEEMAGRLGEQLKRELTAAGVRQSLHRARDRFADILLDQLTGALAEPTPDALAEELTDLGLLSHCRPALERRLARA